MNILLINTIGIVLCTIVVWLVVRMCVAYFHISRRIEEIFSSSEWYKYELDIVGTYNRAMWGYRKWTYKQFFPEDVK